MTFGLPGAYFYKPPELVFGLLGRVSSYLLGIHVHIWADMKLRLCHDFRL